MLPCVILAAVADHYFPGWGRSVLTTTSLSALTVAIMTRLWRYWWFWLLVLALTIAQCFFIVSFRSVLNKLNIFAWFTVVVAEVVIFVAVISIPVSIVSKRNPDII